MFVCFYFPLQKAPFFKKLFLNIMKTKLFFLAFLPSLLSWGQIFESFESGLPTSYTSTLSNVTLGSGTWQIDDVIQGTTGVQTGSYSAQIRSATGLKS